MLTFEFGRARVPFGRSNISHERLCELGMGKILDSSHVHFYLKVIILMFYKGLLLSIPDWLLIPLVIIQWKCSESSQSLVLSKWSGEWRERVQQLFCVLRSCSSFLHRPWKDRLVRSTWSGDRAWWRDDRSPVRRSVAPQHLVYTDFQEGRGPAQIPENNTCSSRTTK